MQSASESLTSIQYPDSSDKRLPAEEGVWVFILGDMMVFGLFFGIFLFYRSFDVETYILSQAKLNQSYAVINTLLLLTSSLFVVLALQAVRNKLHAWALRFFVGAFICGIGFVGVKVLEYGEKFREGVTIATNEFYMFYFVFTGIHLLHLVIGLGVLVYLIVLSNPNKLSDKDLSTLEGGS